MSTVTSAIADHFYPNMTVTFRYMLSQRRPSSVCCLSVTFVHPTQLVNIFPQCFYTMLYLSHPLTSTQYFTEIVPGEPLLWGAKNVRGVAKYSDFGPVEGYISETVQDII